MKLFLFKNIVKISLTVILTLIISGCGSGKELASTWPDQTVQIDGKDSEWGNVLQTFSDDKYSISFKNDDKYLYVCFTISDRKLIFSAFQRGLNTTFSSKLDPAKNYTINFPAAGGDQFNQFLSGFTKDMLEKEGIGFIFDEIIERQEQFNIIQNGIVQTVSLRNEAGIKLKLGTTQKLLVYEMQVPLKSINSYYSLDAMPGENININLSTSLVKVPMKQDQSIGQTGGTSSSGVTSTGGGRGGTGGTISSRGGSGTGMNSRVSNNNSDAPVPVDYKEKFDVDFEIKLAKNKG